MDFFYCYVRPISTDTYSLADDQIVLECRVRGEPFPKITWSQNNRIINSFSDARFKQRNQEDGYCRLIISEPIVDDNATYACLAENNLGDDKTSHNVQFEGRDAHILGKAHGFVHRNINMPSFQNAIGNHMITLGGTIGLQAELLHGVQTVHWFHNGVKLLPVKRKIRIFQEYNLYILVIDDATAEDAGTYLCRATNKLGRAEASGIVDVVPVETKKEDGGGKAPQFVMRPHTNQLIETNKPFSFKVQLAGNPEPKCRNIVWLLDSTLFNYYCKFPVMFMKGLRDITDSDRLLKEQNDDMFRFTLKNTVPRDSGTYWMVARNELGTDRAIVTITVCIMISHYALIINQIFDCIAGSIETQGRSRRAGG